MVKILIPAVTVEEAIAMRDRIKGLILQDDDQAMIADYGVAINTRNPVRVCLELQAEGFI